MGTHTSLSLAEGNINKENTKMPFKAVQAAKCPKCGKSVYANEERLAGGQKWHAGCFACSVCNKMLDSTNLQEKDGILYCKPCHSREFGPKGYGYGVGAGTLSHTGS